VKITILYQFIKMKIPTHLPHLPADYPFWNAWTMEFLQAVETPSLEEIQKN
jgi:hypothetical protein